MSQSVSSKQQNCYLKSQQPKKEQTYEIQSNKRNLPTADPRRKTYKFMGFFFKITSFKRYQIL